MKIRVLGIDDAITFMGTTSQELVQGVSAIVEESAKKHTPIKSGRARRGWSSSTSGQGFRVENRVPYITRLEEGYSSQAPNGIIKPTLREIQRRTK